MFKQLKSALIWIYIIKFRRRLIFIGILLSFALLANYIHSDLVDFLTATDQRHLLIFALLFKWAIIFFSIFGIIYAVLGIFKSEKLRVIKKNQKPPKSFLKAQKNIPQGQQKRQPLEENTLSAREIDFLTKNKLKDQMDFLSDKFTDKAKNIKNIATENGTNFESKSASWLSFNRLNQSLTTQDDLGTTKATKKLKEKNQDLFRREKLLLEKPKLSSKQDFILKKQAKK